MKADTCIGTLQIEKPETLFIDSYNAVVNLLELSTSYYVYPFPQGSMFFRETQPRVASEQNSIFLTCKR